MLKISVPTNWRKDLVPLAGREQVDEFYGKLAQDFIGGGRPAYSISQISRKGAVSHIRDVRSSGCTFNYLLNATCLNNMELTRRGQKEICLLLDWLESMGVERCTVAVPYLLELIKKRYPRFKVYVSTSSRVDSLERARRWEGLGADGIILDSVSVNRNFGLLRQLRSQLKCEMVLIANVNCIYACPFKNYHCTAISHASQSASASQGFFMDYSSLMCGYLRVKYPENFIRADWIRPEDVVLYEDLGIDRIKLVDRTMPTEFISAVASAYINRRYDGNLLDLFANCRKKLMYNKIDLARKIKYLFHPFRINLYQVSKLKDLTFDMFYLDNRSLDGFLEYFMKNDCRLKSCRECGYCRELASRVVKVDRLLQQKLIERYEQYLSRVVSGGIFKYI
ncbi:MAG: U32 family peptidase [Candidatus Omnitrophota bacterium]|jgi:collagenase-like PrtC family protease